MVLLLKMVLLLLVYLSIAILRLNFIVLRHLCTCCMLINLKTVGLPFFSRLLDPKGKLVVFYATNLEGFSHSH